MRNLIIAAMAIGVISGTIVEIGPGVDNVDIFDICKPGYARVHRPFEAYTWTIKQVLTLKRGVNPRDYELDHIVPICLGGSGYHLNNLQLQPWWLAKIKDRQEWAACAAVCHGERNLAEAQNFFRNWRK